MLWVRPGLNHSVSSDEKFGAGINRKPVKQRLEFGPEAIAVRAAIE
jgi:hypothetical protein